MSNAASSDPMEFLRNLWGGNGFSLPGMVTPTLDTDELEKQIRDLKTVEGWLRTNLSMLSMTIQNLEMQRTTITAMKTMGQMYADQTAGTAAPAADPASGDTLAQAAMWPWNMMQQMQESMKTAATDAGSAAAEAVKANATRAAGATEAAAGDAKAAAARRKKAG